MATNASPEYGHAEKQFAAAKTDDEKMAALEEMMRFMPQHKGAESLRANLRLRYKKLREKIEEKKKRKSGGRQGIKKEALQAALIGLTNSGKSSILSNLTNAHPAISEKEFTTSYPAVGTFFHQGLQIQLVDMPAVNHENFDSSLANTTDLLIIVITHPKQIPEITPLLQKASQNRLFVLNKIDLLSEQEKRKLQAYLQSKKYPFVLYSSFTRENELELKDKTISMFNICRIYTRSPGQRNIDNRPILMPPDSSIADVAKKIRIPLENIRQARISGPSSKFPNQVVGLSHVLKDRDILEFLTR